MTHLSFELGGRPLGHDATVVDDGQPLAQLVSFLQVLGGQEHRRTTGVDAAHLIPDRQA